MNYLQNISVFGFSLIEIVVMVFALVLTALIVLIPVYIFSIKRSLQSIDNKMTQNNDLTKLKIKKLNQLLEVTKRS